VNGSAVRPSPSTTVSSAPRHCAAENWIGPGDAHARFGRVVLPHLDDAYALARWLTGSRADAEDVVQDACLSAFRGIDGFANGNARAWLLTIVRHAAYDWLHRNRPSALVLVEDIETVEGAQPNEREVQTPETALIARDDARLLEAAIAALPAPLRETLVLRKLHDMAYREIAAVTGVPVGTVMSRLARARTGLLRSQRGVGATPAKIASHLATA
jgi:RNA polymerase sigma factor (sigma-70 family)